MVIEIILSVYFLLFDMFTLSTATVFVSDFFLIYSSWFDSCSETSNILGVTRRMDRGSNFDIPVANRSGETRVNTDTQSSLFAECSVLESKLLKAGA